MHAHSIPFGFRKMTFAAGRRGGPGFGAGRGFGPGFGPGSFPMGPGPFFRGRARVSRGEVRLAILALLAEEPKHGYQIIQDLAERTGGVWRPSPGSVYPTLQLLEDEGLVRAVETDGKKTYHLTEAGRQASSSMESAPWEDLGVDAAHVALRDLAFGVGAAVMQVAHAGTPDQVEKARQILADARKRLYGLLAEEDGDTAG
jgi:DNA-binding MarR family transcriptional regulator